MINVIKLYYYIMWTVEPLFYGYLLAERGITSSNGLFTFTDPNSESDLFVVVGSYDWNLNATQFDLNRYPNLL